ncbi:MAG: peptidase, partial [Verrucomicrobiota bacterium]
LDDRPGRDVSIVVADRANARLQYFSLEGVHLGFVEGLLYPADIDIQGEVMMVPDLHARISLYDKDNQVITHLGFSEEWKTRALANGFEMRKKPKLWEDGRFIHPHDACFDKDGNILVTEWVATGRVSLLKKLA